MKIAVFGATGMLGKYVAKQLLMDGHEVNALVRNSEKAVEILGDKISMVEGDLKNLEKIKSTLTECEAVYISLSVSPSSSKGKFQPERDGINNILLVAEELGIKRILYLSSLVHQIENNDWWVFDIKRKAVESIKSSSIDHTIFYPSNFMETITEKSIRNGKIMFTGKGEQQLWWISASDYAKQVSKSLSSAQEGKNYEYNVQGLDPYTNEEAYDKFVEICDKYKISKIPEFIISILAVFVPLMSYLSNISKAITSYPEEFCSQETWDALGKPETTLEKFAQQFCEENSN